MLKKLSLRDETATVNDNCIIVPTNDYKINWDIFITLVLLFSCTITPV